MTCVYRRKKSERTGENRRWRGKPDLLRLMFLFVAATNQPVYLLTSFNFPLTKYSTCFALLFRFHFRFLSFVILYNFWMSHRFLSFQTFNIQMGFLSIKKKLEFWFRIYFSSLPKSVTLKIIKNKRNRPRENGTRKRKDHEVLWNSINFEFGICCHVQPVIHDILLLSWFLSEKIIWFREKEISHRETLSWHCYFHSFVDINL